MTEQVVESGIVLPEVHVLAPSVLKGRSLSLLVHSDTKVGKSTLLNTMPAPRLMIDAEAAYRFLPGRKVFWDPMSETPPIYDGTWETCVVIVRSYPQVKRAYEWLNSGQHPFVSVGLDSISEIQTRAKNDLKGEGRMSIQLWGDLLDDMETLVRGFRDLTEHPTRPLECVVLTAMTQLRDGKYRPYVQGQLQVKMPYFLDVIGYMFVQELPDPADPTKVIKMRRMIVVPHIQFEAGERVQGLLGEVVDNPNLPEMLTKVFGPKPAESAATQEGEIK